MGSGGQNVSSAEESSLCSVRFGREEMRDLAAKLTTVARFGRHGRRQTLLPHGQWSRRSIYEWSISAYSCADLVVVQD